MELKTCNILGLDILVTDMEKTVNLIEQIFMIPSGIPSQAVYSLYTMEVN